MGQLTRPPRHPVDRLARRHGRLNAETLSAVHGMTVLRNLAAHPDRDDLDTTRALDYLQLAEAVLHALRNQPRM